MSRREEWQTGLRNALAHMTDEELEILAKDGWRPVIKWRHAGPMTTEASTGEALFNCGGPGGGPRHDNAWYARITNGGTKKLPPAF